jgi:hypothetical protein
MTNAGQDAARAMQGLGDELRRSYVTGRSAPEHTDHAAMIREIVDGIRGRGSLPGARWRYAAAPADCDQIDGHADALAAERDALRAYARELEGDAWGEGGAGMIYSVDQLRAQFGVAAIMDEPEGT